MSCGHLLSLRMTHQGKYVKKCKGAFFGIGAGIDQAPLHTENYEYPDDLLEPTMMAFWKLINP